MLKKSLGQNKMYKKCLLFSFTSPVRHSFTFNLRFLYELKHKARLSKTMCGIFYFWFRFVFIKVYIFAQQIAWGLSDCKWTRTHNHLVHKRRTLNHLAKLALNDWAVLWVLICTVHLTVCSYMSRTRFRVNPHSIVAWMSRNSFLEAGTKSEV